MVPSCWRFVCFWGLSAQIRGEGVFSRQQQEQQQEPQEQQQREELLVK